MPTLFPLIDAFPNWVIWTLLACGIVLLIAGAIKVGECVRFLALMIRYEYKQWKLRRAEVAIALEKLKSDEEWDRRQVRRAHRC